MSVLAKMAATGVTASKIYVDDVFSTYTYKGNSGAQTINNGIDFAGKGGMLWIKNRTVATGNVLFDSVRGLPHYLSSENINAQGSYGASAPNFTATGFSFAGSSSAALNESPNSYVSWSFRKAAKFFDVVQFTTSASANTNQRISHALGVKPGFIIIKDLNNATAWDCWHTSLGHTLRLQLHTTGQQSSGSWGTSEPTSTDFGIDTTFYGGGRTYIAYVFANDTSADGLIKCGSFTTDGNGNVTVSLGWEPQFLLFKQSRGSENWFAVDSMRGLTVNANDPLLYPNTTDVEATLGNCNPTATGFAAAGGRFSSTSTYIYMAIRRPNKPPTGGNQVYNAVTRAGTGAAASITGLGFAPDFVLGQARNTSSAAWIVDKLRGRGKAIFTGSPDAEMTSYSGEDIAGFDMDGISLGTHNNYKVNSPGDNSVCHFLRRAPKVFDVVFFAGTGDSNQRVKHNLGAAPELIILRDPTTSGAGMNWEVYHSAFPSSQGRLDLSSAFGSANASGHNIWGTTPATHTATDFGIDTWWTAVTATNGHVAYLFASLPGVSKVGSYVGNGSIQLVNCGFSTGARFILIKRSDGVGDWYMWDSVRGILAGNDPHLSLNSTSVEVTAFDSIDPSPSGFEVNQNSGANINVFGFNYIFLAIA